MDPTYPDSGSTDKQNHKISEEGNEYSSQDTSSEKSLSSDERDEQNNLSTSKPPNPIHWFGVLIPPALRHAQECFNSAVEGPLLSLLNVNTQMQGVEQKIIYLRALLSKEGNHESKGE